MGRGTYAKGKWALGECARSGRKMLLRNMIADGYYPNLIVDPEWYEPKHPQESLPSVHDPVTLFRPAPDRDRVGGVLALGGIAPLDSVPGGGFGGPIDGTDTGPGGTGGGATGASLAFGYELGSVGFLDNPASNHQWDQGASSTPESDTGVGPDGPFDLPFLQAGPVQVPSLRVDGAGLASDYSNGVGAGQNSVPLIYGNGFTIMYAVRPTAIGGRSVSGGFSRIVPSVHSHLNVQNGIFELGFDNWANPGALDLEATFTILSDSRNYDDIADRAFIEGEARGLTFINTTTVATNKVYHLCGTLSATGRCRLYVNGDLEATASPDINMPSFVSTSNNDLTNAARAFRLTFECGIRQLAGAKRGTGNAGDSDIDEVRWYDSELTASEVAFQADLINFT